MATTKEYKEFVLEQLHLLNPVMCRSMMGEYLLYYNNQLFGGIYDNQLLIKKAVTNEKYELKSVIPYHGAKEMFLIEEMDDIEKIKEIIIATCE